MGERQYLIVSLWCSRSSVLFFLRSARDLFVPIALGFLTSHALEPVVVWLERHRISRPFGDPAVVLLVLALTGRRRMRSSTTPFR